MERKFFTRIDLVLLAVALLAVVAVFVGRAFPPGGHLYADIQTGDGVTETVDLSAVTGSYTKTVFSGGHTLTLEISPRQIAVVEADCPDKCCVACGRLTRPGSCAICLPARVVVRLRSDGKGSEVDAVL